MLNRAMELFLEYIDRERNFSPHTHVSYSKDLHQFQAFLQGKFPETLHHPERIDQEIVRSFLGVLLDSGMSKKKRRSKNFYASFFFQICCSSKTSPREPDEQCRNAES